MQLPLFIRPLLLAAILPAVLTAQTPAPTETPTKLEPFEVTGSRVKRLDYEMPSPVVMYTVEDIAATGYATFGEFIQNLSFNNGDFNSELNPTGTWVPGAATANPRGLGSNRLLTLVNGRRTAPFSMTYSGSGSPQSVFNFNSIPFDAVERVEYLKDGASALYGSDAITGVMNIILKKNYSGASLDLFVSNPLKGGDTQTRRATFVAGGAKGGWDGLLGLSRQERHASYLPDFGVTSTDYRYLGTKGLDFRTIYMPPSFLNLTAVLATSAGLGNTAGFYVIPGGVPTGNPTKASFVYAGPTTASIPNTNRYDNVANVQLSPASDSTGAFGMVGRRLTPTVSAYAQFTFNRSHTYYEDQPINGPFDLAALPATNPYTPLGIAVPAQRFAISTGDFRPRNKVSSQAVTAITGLRGRVGETGEWESAFSYGNNHSVYAQDGALIKEVQAALNGTTRATAYNPFGPSDNPNLIRELFRHRFTVNDNLAEALSATLTVTGKPWKLPLRGAGELGVAAGYEFRRESLDARPNQTSYFAYIGGTQEPWAGHRQVHAWSAEITVPLQKWIEIQLAARHERYSDFGSTTNPKVGVALRLPETRFMHVMLRASRSESFKAPDFGQLYQPRTGASGGPSLVDPLRPQDGAHTYFQYIGGSPSLEPEKGTVQYAGAVFDVKAVRGLSFTVDFLDIQMRDVINKLDLAYLFSPEGRRLFPDAIVRDNSAQNPGPVSYYLGTYQNHGFQLFRGWDFGMRYLSPRTRWGRLSFNATATQVVKKGTDFGTGAGFVDNTGNYNTPVWRGNFSTGWSREKISATVAANVIGKLYNRRFTSTGWGENVYAVITPTLTYRGFERTTLSLTCGNVFDHRPPANGRANIRGFDLNVYGVGASGRTLSLRARREF